VKNPRAWLDHGINGICVRVSHARVRQAGRVAQRISSKDATENLRIIEQLQRWLHTNVQEALALEVGLLKLQL